MVVDKARLLGQGGMRLVRQLFYENDQSENKSLCVYTILKHDRTENGITYPSLYRLYMEEDDLTEARFVDKHLYDWQQWENIAASATYKDEVARWRLELKKHVMGGLVDALRNDAFDEDSKSSMSSAKYLLDRFGKANKGRPRSGKAADSDEVKHSLAKEVEDDIARLTLISERN